MCFPFQMSRPQYCRHVLVAGNIVKEKSLSKRTGCCRFEKRDFNRPAFVLKVPRMQDVPPFHPAMTMSVFLPGTQVTPRLHGSMTDFMKQVNAAINTLPDLGTAQQ